jgi:ESS family glutamate:Na+ symporter
MIRDFALISAALIIAQLLRATVPWLSRYLIPSSVIAGLLALAAGPEGAGLLPFTETDGRLTMANYPGILISFVFATLLMGHQPKTTGLASRLVAIGDTLAYNLAAEIGQYGFAIFFGIIFVFTVFPDLPLEFGVMLAAGFAGGHATAAAFGDAFGAAGWEEALSIGFTFATLGLLFAVLGGLLLINIAVRRGWTEHTGEKISADVYDSFLSQPKRHSSGTVTVHSIALDSIAWHIALVGTAVALVDGTLYLAYKMVPGNYWLPEFALAMFAGFLLQKMLDAVGYGDTVDKSTMERFGGFFSDYLVAFGIASIKVAVVVEYMVPIIVFSCFGFFYATALLLFAAKRVFENDWFERGLFTYGWTTGVVGFGVALLRVVDPRFRTSVLKDYGTAYFVIGPVEVLMYPAIIAALLAGHHVAAGLLLVAIATALLTGGAVLKNPQQPAAD